MELESFAPQELIQILKRGIAVSGECDRSDGGVLDWFDDTGGGGVYASENFG